MRRPAKSRLEKSHKVIIGLALAIIGSGLAFFMAVTPDRITDYLGLAFGVLLILGYCFLSWDWFTDFFGKDASIVMFTPPLVTFGILSVYLSLTKPWLESPGVLLAFGIIIIVIPIALLVYFLRDIIGY